MTNFDVMKKLIGEIDPDITKDMMLCNDGLDVQLYKDKSLYSFKMK